MSTMMSGFEEIPVIDAGKRIGVQFCPWMGGDWFTSWSPRNGNNNAEGSWDAWVSLAMQILNHPATTLVYPEAQQAIKGVPVREIYTGAIRELTAEESAELFPPDEY